MSGLGAVDHLVEQLWAPVLASGDVRIRLGAAAPGGDAGGWHDLETYLALPSVASATMLPPVETSEIEPPRPPAPCPLEPPSAWTEKP